MGPKKTELWVWSIAVGLALVIHVVSLPQMGRWLTHTYTPPSVLPPISLDLASLSRPKKKKIPPKPKERLPDQEKKLTDQPDKISKNAQASEPTGGAAKFGTQQGREKAQKLADLKKALHNQAPKSTGEDGLKYVINTYKWSYKRFMENWAVAMSNRWLGSADYLRGDYPQGGYVWVKITLTKAGLLDGYEVIDQNVSADMSLMVVYAVMGVRSRPRLPNDFPKDKLVAYWRFVYPTFAELKKSMKQARAQ